MSMAWIQQKSQSLFIYLFIYFYLSICCKALNQGPFAPKVGLFVRLFDFQQGKKPKPRQGSFVFMEPCICKLNQDNWFPLPCCPPPPHPPKLSQAFHSQRASLDIEDREINIFEGWITNSKHISTLKCIRLKMHPPSESHSSEGDCC